MVDLTTLNNGLKARGIGGRVVDHDNKLYWRTTVTSADGKRSDRRIRLDLPANNSQLLTAESRVVGLAAEIGRFGILPDPLPWASEITKSPDSLPGPLTIAEAIASLEEGFWAGKVRTSATERSWDRLQCELRRLPQEATINTDLLVGVAATTAAGSRSRLEACKTYKRLGRAVGLAGLERLDAIKTPYEPKERLLPSDQEVAELIERVKDHPKYGWLTWALATYGCRPSETFSLIPAGDGTARVLTVKRKGKLPAWRTGLALPVLELEIERAVPWDVSSPAQYDSETARRLVQAWGNWLKSTAPGRQLYDMRHAWAVRSIRKNINSSLAAKTMGHSLAVHHSTYHAWLEQSDVAAVAAQLAKR